MMNCPAFLLVYKQDIINNYVFYEYPINIYRLIRDLRTVLTYSKNTYETIYNPKIQ